MGTVPVKVGQLNQYIGRVLGSDPILSDLSVIGEISNLKFHSSGHVYFSLKDERSRVNCFLPSRIASRLSCPMEEGLEVIASGYVSVYERGGYYSLNVTGMEVSGTGALAEAFEKMKKKLASEGLFDPERKKQIPAFPKKVAVVTSPTGAAVKDILKIIRSRNQIVDVLIYPVLVQGPAAAGQIASAIDDLNENHSDVSVIITGRGGGSMEELWAFNEEIVARSIARSVIPVISAVGHETDFTIADFAADARAETPTAAAQMAVPDISELDRNLEGIMENMNRLLLYRLERCEKRLAELDPSAFAAGISTRIAYEQMNLDRIAETMREAAEGRLRKLNERIEMLHQLLETASPFSIMDRGYAIVSAEDGSVLSSTGQMHEKQDVNIRVSDGSARAVITGIGKEHGDE